MTIDPRLKRMSYSSDLLLHSCPRKYELYKLQSLEVGEDSEEDSVTFSFGHLVGEGIQLILQNLPLEKVIWTLFIKWPHHLFLEDDKRQKSFFYGIFAIKKFLDLYQQGFFYEYELIYVDEKPATELSFIVYFPDGFVDRGFVDAVLRHKPTGKITVLEVKTTSQRTNAAMYKNSSQAIRYSIVLDHLFHDITAYDVMYLVYETKDQNYVPLKFSKSYLQRAQWIQSKLHDIEAIKRYAESGVFPMYGESCFSYFRECKYLGICEMSTEHLTQKLTEQDIDIMKKEEETFQIKVTLQELIESQLRRAKL